MAFALQPWLLPLAIAVLFALAVTSKAVAPQLWRSDGGLLVLLGVVVALAATVRSSR